MSDAMESLLQSVATAEKLKTKSNDELADIIEEHVWADFEMCSAQSVLLGEVMDRLRNLKTCASCHGWGYVEHARCVPCSGTGDVAPPADAATEAVRADGVVLADFLHRNALAADACPNCKSDDCECMATPAPAPSAKEGRS